MNLRQITIKDQINLKRIYFDSIQSIDEKIYNKEQKLAWSSQAWINLEFHKSITKGKGFIIENYQVIHYNENEEYKYHYDAYNKKDEENDDKKDDIFTDNDLDEVEVVDDIDFSDDDFSDDDFSDDDFLDEDF